MIAVLGVLWRLAVVALGYGVAALVASLFLNLVFTASLEEAAEAVAGPSLLVVAFFTLFVGYFAFLPSIVAIAAAEIFGRRDWPFYALAGAAVSIAATASHVALAGWQGGQVDTDFSLAIVASGAAAGLAYWLVAGRRAGLWLQKPEG